MEYLGRFFSVILNWCNGLTGNFWWAIVVFTLITKIILLPVSVMVQRNSIKMVRMYPEMNLKDVYMFFDEIQNVAGWDLFVLRVFKSYCEHVYVTGSNAKLLSSEISTALRGWTLDYEMLPLSFRELCRFKGIDADSYLESDKARRYAAMEEYIYGGAFPKVVLTSDKSLKLRLLQGYFNTMLFRDLAERHEIKNIEALRYFQTFWEIFLKKHIHYNHFPFN